MRCKSSVPKIITALKIQIKLGNITTLNDEDVYDFIKTHIRDKKGKNLDGAVNSAKNRDKKEANKVMIISNNQ